MTDAHATVTLRSSDVPNNPEGPAWALALSLTAALAVWMNLGSLHEFQHADSLLSVLISTQRWTLFYWGQDRFGTLVPLLAMPIRHPLANMLAQSWLMTVVALLAAFVVGRFVTDRREEWLAIGALTNVFFLIVTAPVTQFDWIVQPYALSIALGFSGLIVADEIQGLAGLASAAALLFLAHWGNLGVFDLLAPMVVLTRGRTLRRAMVVTLGLAGGLLLARQAPLPHTPTALSPVSGWISGWLELVRKASTTIAHPFALFIVVLAAAASVVFAIARPQTRQGLATGGAVLATALISWLVVGTSDWVRLNLYYPRYMFPTLMMLTVAAAIVIVATLAGPPARHPRWGALAGPPARHPRWGALAGPPARPELHHGLLGAGARRTAVVGCIALALTTVVLYGPPSLGRLERSLDDRFGGMTADVLGSGATVIAGDYWTVWPAVFHANLSLYRTHRRGEVFGLTFRSEATDVLWNAVGTRTLVAGAPSDGTVVRTADRHNLRLTLLEHKPSIDLFVGITAP